MLDHVLADDDNWASKAKQEHDQECDSPFDEREEHKHKEPVKAGVKIENPAGPPSGDPDGIEVIFHAADATMQAHQACQDASDINKRVCLTSIEEMRKWQLTPHLLTYPLWTHQVTQVHRCSWGEGHCSPIGMASALLANSRMLFSTTSEKEEQWTFWFGKSPPVWMGFLPKPFCPHR